MQHDFNIIKTPCKCECHVMLMEKFNCDCPLKHNLDSKECYMRQVIRNSTNKLKETLKILSER